MDKAAQRKYAHDLEVKVLGRRDQVRDMGANYQKYVALADAGAIKLGEWVVVNGDYFQVFTDKKLARADARKQRGATMENPMVFLQHGESTDV